MRKILDLDKGHLFTNMPDGNESSLPGFIQEARGTAQETAGFASDFASRAATIPDEMKRAVNEAIGYNKEFVEMRQTALSDYFSAPDVAGAKFGTEFLPSGEANPDFIFNPFRRNEAISQYVNTEFTPFSTYNYILGLAEGSAADIMEAGTRSFNAQAIAAQAASDSARTHYTDVLNEFRVSEDIRLREMEIARRGTGGGLSTAQSLATIRQSLTNVAENLMGRRKRNLETSGEEYLGTDEIEQEFEMERRYLQEAGLSDAEINREMAKWMNQDDVISSFSQMEGGKVVEGVREVEQPSGGVREFPSYEYQPRGYTPPRNWLQKVSDTIFRGGGTPTVAPTSSNLQRGVSNVDSFTSDFTLSNPKEPDRPYFGY